MSDTEYATKLFGQLDRLEDHYRRFLKLAFGAIALLTIAVLWFLLVALPDKTNEIQQSRSAVIHQFCEDEKSLLKLVPPGYPLPAAAGDPGSALNPRRDCDQFVRAHVLSPP